MQRRLEVVAEQLGLFVNEATVQSAVYYLLGELEEKQDWKISDLKRLVKETFKVVL